MLQIYDLQISAQIAICCVVFADILTREKMIFAEYGRAIEEYETRHPVAARLLGYCAKCTAGQVAFFVFGWIVTGDGVFSVWQALFRHVSAVSLTILLSACLSAFVGRWIR
ncbi:MAG: hypothetical protein KDC70_00305 [Saprospiraceae bacterium]|nr:hypothetical protein [Saprospiraceae bacterium]